MNFGPAASRYRSAGLEISALQLEDDFRSSIHCVNFINS